MRCFVAAEVSGEVRDALGTAAAKLRPLVAGAKWVPAGNIHMTLRFLGEVTEAEAAAAGDSLAAMAANLPPFRVSFRGLGVFPSERRATVLWAGVLEGERDLVRLAALVSTATSAIGNGGKEKPFVPHLTIARFREPAEMGKLAVFSELKQTELGICDIGGIVLMRSHLRPEGAQYEVLRAIPLGGSR